MNGILAFLSADAGSHTQSLDHGDNLIDEFIVNTAMNRQTGHPITGLARIGEYSHRTLWTTCCR